LEFEFPRINNIDSLVYLEIQKTCDAHWDLGSMEATTFVINSYTNEYAVYCAGSLNNQYYWFIIHADNNGKWLSDGRAEYNGRGSFFNVKSFEQLKLEDIKSFWDGESKIDTSMGGRLDSSPGFLDDYTRISNNNDKRIKVSVFKLLMPWMPWKLYGSQLQGQLMLELRMFCPEIGGMPVPEIQELCM